MRSRIAFTVAMTSLTACFEVAGTPIYAGPQSDAGTLDAGKRDAGTDGGHAADPDSGSADSGRPDARTPDAGPCPECPDGPVDPITQSADGRTFLFYDISEGGRFVAFSSRATNLLPTEPDSEAFADVFVFDRSTRTYEIVSRNQDGELPNDDCRFVSMTGDGRLLAFTSGATNLVPEDSDPTVDAFLVDRETGIVTRPAAAAGNGNARFTQLSEDGRFLVFSSVATDLVPGDDNGVEDVFLLELATNRLTLVSQSQAGDLGGLESEEPSISGDGRFIAFTSRAANLVPGDTRDRPDVFLYDREAVTLARVSNGLGGSAGAQSSLFPWITRDGSAVAFRSFADDLVPGDTNADWDVFVWERATGEIERVSETPDGLDGDGNSVYISISTSARYVAFSSGAANLTPDDSNNTRDIFVRDRSTDRIVRLLPQNGAEPDGMNQFPVIAPDGASVLFRSFASNWGSGVDEDGEPDIYIVRNPLIP